MTSPRSNPSPQWRDRYLVAIVTAALAACGSASDAPLPPATVRDSAGVMIRELGSGPWSVPRMEARARVRYGSGPGDYPFQRILHGALRPDGSAAVHDTGAQELVTISRDGEGRVLLTRGQGPGELGQVFGVASHGDSLLVDDVGNARILVLEGDSVVAGYSKTGIPELSWKYTVRGVSAGGEFALVTTGFYPPEVEGWIPGALVRWDPAGTVLDTVGRFPLTYAVPMDAPGRTPFMPSGYSSHAGSRWVVGRSDRPELRRIDGAGGVVEIIRWPRPADPEPALDRFDRYVERLPQRIRDFNPGIGDAQLEARFQRTLEGVVIDESDVLPFFDALEMTPDQEIWVGEYGFPDPPTRYVLLGADGQWRGTVEFPAPTRMLDARGDLVLGVIEGELGEPVVVVFQVTGAGETPL